MIENRANRESEPFLESDDDYDYDEYQSVELANKAWPVPGILSSIPMWVSKLKIII